MIANHPILLWIAVLLSPAFSIDKCATDFKKLRPSYFFDLAQLPDRITRSWSKGTQKSFEGFIARGGSDLRLGQILSACLAQNRCDAAAIRLEELERLAIDRGEHPDFLTDPEWFRIRAADSRFPDPLREPDLDLMDPAFSLYSPSSLRIDPADRKILRLVDGRLVGLGEQIAINDFSETYAVPEIQSRVTFPTAEVDVLGAFNLLQKALTNARIPVVPVDPKISSSKAIFTRWAGDSVPTLLKNHGKLTAAQLNGLADLVAKFDHLGIGTDLRSFVWDGKAWSVGEPVRAMRIHHWRKNDVKGWYFDLSDSPASQRLTSQLDTLVKDRRRPLARGLSIAFQKTYPLSLRNKLFRSLRKKVTPWFHGMKHEGLLRLASAENGPVAVTTKRGEQIAGHLVKVVNPRTGIDDVRFTILKDDGREETYLSGQLDLETSVKPSYQVAIEERPLLQRLARLGAERKIIGITGPPSNFDALVMGFTGRSDGSVRVHLKNLLSHQEEVFSVGDLLPRTLTEKGPLDVTAHQPFASTTARANGFDYLGRQVSEDDLIYELTNGTIFPQSSQGTSAVYFSLVKDPSMGVRSTNYWRDCSLIYDLGLLDRRDWHLSTSWKHGEFNAAQSARGFRKRELEQKLKALSASIDQDLKEGNNSFGYDNEVVFAEPVPLTEGRELIQVIVPANRRDPVVARLKAAGLKPPLGKDWNTFVLGK